jgi:hypothetical protein
LCPLAPCQEMERAACPGVFFARVLHRIDPLCSLLPDLASNHKQMWVDILYFLHLPTRLKESSNEGEYVAFASEEGVRRWHLVVLCKLFRDPSLLIASLLTFIELGGPPVPWYWMVGVTLVNLLLVRIIAWLMTLSLLYCLLFLYKAGKRGLFRRPIDQDIGTSGYYH